MLIGVLYSCSTTKNTSKTSKSVTDLKTVTVDSCSLKTLERKNDITVSSNTVKNTTELITTYYRIDSTTKRIVPDKQIVDRKVYEVGNSNSVDKSKTGVTESNSLKKKDQRKFELKDKTTQIQKTSSVSTKCILISCIILLLTIGIIYLVYKLKSWL